MAISMNLGSTSFVKKNVYMSNKAIADKKISKAKTQITGVFVGPDGKSFEFTNIKQFCRDHALSAGGMYCLARGAVKSNLGWTLGKKVIKGAV